MEDLIWQGSQISTSGKLFSHSELKTKLKVLDERWKACQSIVQERLMALRSVQGVLAEKEMRFVEVFSQLDATLKCVQEEEMSKDRTMEVLEKFSMAYEVRNLLLSSRDYFKPNTSFSSSMLFTFVLFFFRMPREK